MADDARAHSDDPLLTPLVGLVDRLRAEVEELQGRWEALGEELEGKRRRLRLGGHRAEILGGRVQILKQNGATSLAPCSSSEALIETRDGEETRMGTKARGSRARRTQ
jgi:hypothetical protein